MNLYYDIDQNNPAREKLTGHIDQWIRLGSPGIKPCKYGQMIFNKAAKTLQRHGTVSSTNSTGKTRYLVLFVIYEIVLGKQDIKRMNLDPYLTPYTKINSK